MDMNETVVAAGNHSIAYSRPDIVNNCKNIVKKSF